MKSNLLFILFVLSLTSIYAQDDAFIFNNKLEINGVNEEQVQSLSESRSELMSLIKQLKSEIALLSGKDSSNKENLKKISKLAQQCEINLNELNNLNEQYDALLEKQTNEPSEEEPKLVGDISINPTASDNSNVITPSLAFTYSKDFSKVKNKKIYGKYFLSFNIKAPVESKDSVVTLNNLIKLGGDGKIDFSLMARYDFDDIVQTMIGVSAKLNWFYSKDFTTTKSSGSAYGTGNGFIALKVYPIMLGLNFDYNLTSGNENNFLLKELNNSTSTYLMIGLVLGQQYKIQMKYIIKTNKTEKTNENFEIKFGVAYNPFD